MLRTGDERSMAGAVVWLCAEGCAVTKTKATMMRVRLFMGFACTLKCPLIVDFCTTTVELVICSITGSNTWPVNQQTSETVVVQQSTINEQPNLFRRRDRNAFCRH